MRLSPYSALRILRAHVLSVGRILRQLLAGCVHVPAFAHQVVGDRAAQGRVGDVVGGVGFGWKIAARQLVLALCAGLGARNAVLDGVIDGLVVSHLEMQERVVLQRAPVAAIEAIAADQMEGAGDLACPSLGQHDEAAIPHRAHPQQREELAV